MKIKINLKILLFLFLLILTRQVKIYLFIMFFALLHEIGHIIAGAILGIFPEEIEIFSSRIFS